MSSYELVDSLLEISQLLGFRAYVGFCDALPDLRQIGDRLYQSVPSELWGDESEIGEYTQFQNSKEAGDDFPSG